MSPTGAERDDLRSDAEERFRRWASLPPATAPQEAARRVVARLDEHPAHRFGWGWAPRLQWAAAAVLLVALTTAGWWLKPGSSPAPPGTAGSVEVAPPLDEGVVLLWLDSQTPLYMTLTPPPPAAKKGDLS